MGEGAGLSAVAAESRLGTRALHRQPVLALDGAAGELADVLFEDEQWRVRYLVVDEFDRMPRRDVLVAPEEAELARGALRVRLTREQLKRCPDLDEIRPVYLQFGMAASPRPGGDPHLRSAEIMLGFAARVRGARAGRLTDIEFDPGRWLVVSLVLDNGVLVPGERRRLAPQRVNAIDWIGRSIDFT